MSKPDFAVTGAVCKNEKVDLLVADGKVLELVPGKGADAYPDTEIVDGAGLVLLPGMTDAHVHLREPGFEYKEDIASGLDAAAHGGFSNIMCMANTNPVNDDSSVTEMMLDKAKATHPHNPRLFPIGALTKGLKGKELSPLNELAQAGCAAFSNDGVPVEDTEIFRRAMEYASDIGKVVIDHCEDPYLAPGVGMNEGTTSGRLGLAAQPDAAEAAQVARDVLLAEYLDMPVHLAHISCEKSVALIRWAKERGVKVTAETCPHYLFLTEERVEGYDTAAKVNPPLRTDKDVEAIRQALREGVIDILATDHAPHAAHEKETEFDIAPCGISGLDTALPLTWALVEDGTLPLDDFLRAWTTGPARIFGLPVNTFKPGDPADFFLFDPAVEWVVGPDAMRSKGKNTPFAGQPLKGRVVAHFLEGKKRV